MKQSNKTKKSLVASFLALVMCFSMFAGTTMAWFTDTATTGVQNIVAGNLKVDIVDENGNTLTGEPLDFVKAAGHEDEEVLWEPGVTYELESFYIQNKGSLALKYKLYINGAVGDTKLMEAIDFSVEMDGQTIDIESFEGALNNKNDKSGLIKIKAHMDEAAGNIYQGLSLSGIGITVSATQAAYESDSFGNTYDQNAEYYVINHPVNVFYTIPEEKIDADNKLTEDIVISGGNGVQTVIPAGTKLEDGATQLNFTVTHMDKTSSNIQLGENEELTSVDVHIDGVAETNTTPIEICLGNILSTGLNSGNYYVSHVENGVTNIMTEDSTPSAHNEFTYDPATGFVTISIATFSEVAVVADTENAWNGTVATGFVGGTGAKADPYLIANADQLAFLNECISNENDTYGSAYYKLIADINLGGEENANSGIIFYPIGYHKEGGEIAALADDDAPEAIYQEEADTTRQGVAVATAEGGTTWYTYGGSFKGTFDGNGHKISNIYQNTWQMKGNYAGNYWNAAMGLFGYVYGGTVKNLTVENFSSDGEFTPTGVIAAYAAGDAAFENIAITNCNPRVYNTGNGGIIGIAGDTRGINDDHLTLKNITVDNSNKISALWGSWDVACGGLVGMYRGNVDGSDATGDTISFENCHVSAQIDVYNDVCANYQYYAYRYAGMIIGSVRHNTKNIDGKTIPNMTGISATDCTVNYGDWNDYYYCEFEKNTIASYSEDYQFSRVPHSELNFTDSNGNGVVDADERASVTGCKHTHTANEDKQAVYLPFHQLFTGYSWGVSSIGLKKYSGIVTDLDITEGDQQESVVKFETKFTGDFLYRVGNQNTVSIGSLFAAKDGVTISDSGVWTTIEKVDENSNVSGTFTANTSDWTEGAIKFNGTGVVKVTIQDYNFCTPTELYLEVVDATNLTSATGTTSGGTFVLLCDVNASDYVYYWNSTLYGNGFKYDLNGAPTVYSSSHGHGVIMTKNATLDNLKIVGDVYGAYGAYTNQDYYNAAIDVLGDTVIQNCYISGCASPVNARANVTIKNTTLYGGAVANLMIKSGTVTLEDVITANYADGRELVGMGIVAHSDVSESAKLVINGTLKQYNFVNENNIPSDSNAKILYNAMFDDACSQYHFDTDKGKYVNTGIISMSALFNASDITDNANTGYVGSTVSVNGVNGYVYTQPNTSGSVDNSYTEEDYFSATQGAVPPAISFDHTVNEEAKTDGSNDYCYEESGTVYISMDEGDSFYWNTSILTVTKLGQTLDYTVTMNGTDYTGGSIAFNTAGDYTVTYTYTDENNFKLDGNGNITTYKVTYTKTVNINVSVIKPTTKHAEFTFGSAGTASTSTTVGNNTYIMPNVTATSITVGSITVSGTTIYYPIVDAYTSDGATAHSSLNSWYMCYPVFKNVISITDYESGGTGNAVTYGSSTTTMPSGLSLTAYSKYFSQTTAPSGAVSFTSGGADTAFKYQASNSASSTPTTLSNVLIYASPTLSNNARDEMYLLVQYKYQDNAGATYYYYVGYHMPQTTVKSVCVTPDTLVTVSDGSQKRIDEVTYSDALLVWDFFTGEYTYAPASIIFNHGYDNYTVIKLTFENGDVIKAINNHGFFSVKENKFVFIDKENAESYVDEEFIAVDGSTYKITKLVEYEVYEEYTGSYSIQTAQHNNFVIENMFSITQPEYEGWFDYFEIGEDLKYDEVKMQADIEKYGLYTYKDFADYVTYEQFIAFSGPYLKVLVCKGVVTYEQILELIAAYVQ